MRGTLNKMVPENLSYFEHTMEGSDDMPAHIKNALVGNTISVPVTDGKLNLGTWQGIYLCEFPKLWWRQEELVLTPNGKLVFLILGLTNR